ncbi:NACHT, LRR and PYD domains-containing protein 6 [Apteryx mantelli]|uniref:NACHT, LRR and PYD domains-containing protein 3 n=1 Tax=Apteryx mantelli TaxID=2696672 RepID=A0ABM4EFG7_9AVES
MGACSSKSSTPKEGSPQGIAGELLLHALEELPQQDFKRFRDTLAHGDHGGQRCIPWGRLETADRTDTKNLMLHFYGKDAVLDVAVAVLEQIHLCDAAARLREGREKDYRKKYKKEICNIYSRIKDRNACVGDDISLNARYSELVIVNKPRDEEQREHEIMAMGRMHAEIMKKQANSSVTIGDLFKPSPDGWTPRVVVLLGAAGIGKTMAAKKIMLDWASDKVFVEFDYVFYIHCRDGNLLTSEASVADLISRCCPGSSPPLTEMLKSPEKLLFVIDGFDELRFSFDQPQSDLCSQPWEKRPVEITLSSLFRKTVLHECSLLVTTRPAALQKLGKCLECERCMEILGFSEAEREEYFHKFFENAEQAAAALQFVRGNETLFTMCLVPIVCWITCTIMKQQFSRKSSLAQSTKTTTGIYIRYLSMLSSSLSSELKQDMPVVLRRLCCLAADGVWKQKVLFEEEEVQRYTLDQREVLPLLLNEHIFQKDIDCVSTYSFIHLSFQEFFAALFYLLEDEGETQTLPAGPTRDVNKLLENYGNSRNYFMLTVRFLFGLLNEEQRNALEKETGCKISPKITQELLMWLQKSQKTALAVLTQETTLIRELEVCHCLYEIQDERFVTTALDHFTGVYLRGVNLNRFDQIVLSFSIKNFPRLESLNLGHCSFIWDNPEDYTGPQKAKQAYREKQQEEGKDSPIHLLCQALEKSGCKLKTLRVVEGRLLVLAGQNSLLHWEDNPTSPRRMAWWDRLFSCFPGAVFEEQPGFWILSVVATLERGWLVFPWVRGAALSPVAPLHLSLCRFDRCQLTGACCGALAPILRAKITLTELDLGGNDKLGDGGVKLLCEGLSHAACQVQTLRLGCCNLTAASCKDLAAVLSATPSLAHLDLSDNHLADRGVQELCRGLMQPKCRVEKLWLWRCRLKEKGCGALATALCANPSVTELHLGDNELGDRGVRRLCESLRDGACRVQTLRLWRCCLKEEGCRALAAALRTNQSLRELHLGDNKLGDRGVRRLCESLRDGACRVQMLSLWQCQLTDACCADFATVLSASQSLVHLDLSENNLGDSGVQLLCEGLRHPTCLLQRLWLNKSGLSEEMLQNLAALKEIKPSLNIGYV